eukprot:TRINITY_DN75525_c0_g1_i1.p1 TRINITY_DN75525_c0_g1~~TRINITY_DN75525_c0_g1_i1.p1  ORF type:complete len:721 (+),score=146.70 TRINITY_DN75525_c0_g1_i1:93-2165(+)
MEVKLPLCRSDASSRLRCTLTARHPPCTAFVPLACPATAMTASLAAVALGRSRRCSRGLGELLRLGSRAHTKDLVPEAQTGQDECPDVVRFGATEASTLHWLQERFSLADPETSFEGIVLGREAVGCGPGQLTTFLRYLDDGQVDFVVAAAKDVVLELPESFAVAAVLREDARDAVLVRRSLAPVSSLSDLPPGSRISAPSLRRRLQILARFPELQVEESRPPMQTRLRHLAEQSSDYDALVATAAGLRRNGFTEFRPLDASEITPAIGQGALVLLCKAGDEDMLSLLGEQDDADARCCVAWERQLRRQLGRLPPGSAVGALAEILPEGQLHLRCTLAQLGQGTSRPTIFAAERCGPRDEAEAFIRDIAHELEPELQMTREFPSSSTKPSSVQAEEDDDEEDADSIGDQALPPFGDIPLRIPVAEVDGTGGTLYKGRVCAVLPGSSGFLVDINCELPAHWQPELSTPCSGASSSSSRAKFSPQASGSATPEVRLPALGRECEVYCCLKQPWHLRVVTKPPPRLAVRGGLERLRLEELRPGLGPWRAVVISVTAAGTLVDFNCEMPGQLFSDSSDQQYARGDELRVYCYKADTVSRTCVVGTLQDPPFLASFRRKLEDLTPGGPAVRGTVLKVIKAGIFIDINCEVQGYLSPMDIDIDSWPEGLSTGHEVTVYIVKVDLLKRQVRVSMFRQ